MNQHPFEIQRLVDRAAIQDLLMRYFRGIDSADPEQVRACFTDDVRAAYDGRTFVDGIDALMSSFLAFRNKASGQWIETTHFMGNLSYLRLDDDIAETEVYAIAFLVTPGTAANMVAMRSLRYLDRLRKTAGAWRIRDRVHTLDWSCEVPVASVASFSKRITQTLPARDGT
ncbi:MAG: nuclear transport factor 2 family protein [Burkholderiales bacterium]